MAIKYQCPRWICRMRHPGAALLIAAFLFVLIPPLAGQSDQSEEEVVPANPPWMKYFYVTAGGNLMFVPFPWKFYSSIKVVDNVYDYPHSSLELGESERWTASRFSPSVSIGFAFLAYEKTSITVLGDVELSYAKNFFADGTESCRETTVYFDSSKSEEDRIEIGQDLSFAQTERSQTAISLMVKFGANFISSLPRLFFLLGFGLSSHERTFVSGLSKNYEGKLDFSDLKNREVGDFGTYKNGGKWVRRNYPVQFGLELRYYLFNNFALNAGWMVQIGRKPMSIYYSETDIQKTNDVKILAHGLNVGLSLVF
jgi:hypothetical protein